MRKYRVGGETFLWSKHVQLPKLNSLYLQSRLLHHFQTSSTEKVLPSSCTTVLKSNPFNSVAFTSAIGLNTITTAAKPNLWLLKTSPPTLFPAAICGSSLQVFFVRLHSGGTPPPHTHYPTAAQVLPSAGRCSPLFASSLVCFSAMTSRSQRSRAMLTSSDSASSSTCQRPSPFNTCSFFCPNHCESLLRRLFFVLLLLSPCSPSTSPAVGRSSSRLRLL